MTNYPARIRYVDKDEVQVVKSSEDIQNGRAYVVEEVTWGRKTSTCGYATEGEDDYEN